MVELRRRSTRSRGDGIVRRLFAIVKRERREAQGARREGDEATKREPTRRSSAKRYEARRPSTTVAFAFASDELTNAMTM